MTQETSVKQQKPLKPGIFHMPEKPGEKPYLVACKCGNCSTYFYPRRAVCLNCGSQDMHDAPLGGKGKVYTYTIARQQLPGALVKVPYAVVIVIMEEGCQIHGVITEDFDKVDVDMDVEVYFEKMSEDKEGNDLLSYKFRAVKG